ncbi:MAG: hypothetical protein ACOCQA_00950 [bacterium]
MLKNRSTIIAALILVIFFLSGLVFAQSPPGNPDVGFEFPGQGEFRGHYNPFLSGNGNNSNQGNGQNNNWDDQYFGLDKGAYIYQYGNYNDGKIEHHESNFALIKQCLWANEGEIYQDGSDNYAFVVQKGVSNQGNLKQIGADNLALIGQIGINNKGCIDQNGNSNTAAIMQLGNDHDYTIIQDGNETKIELMFGF